MKIRAIAMVLALLAMTLLAGCGEKSSKTADWGPLSGAR